MPTTTCDFCEAEYATDDRHVVATRRPSDPAELVAIMWACPTCGDEQGLPTPAELHEQVEAGTIEGVLWVTV